MKVLLIGEYSGFYNNLKLGLQHLGHQVLHVGRKDAFKQYDVDISLEPVFFSKGIGNFIRKGFHKITGYDIGAFESYILFLKYRKHLKDFDVVQIINSYPIQTPVFTEKKILSFIFNHNKKVFLSACGDDPDYINFLLTGKLENHILTPYLKNKALKNHYTHSLKFTKKRFKKLHDFVLKHVEKVIPADFDYELAYRDHIKTSDLIPYPINLDRLQLLDNRVEDKVVIFHGINKNNYFKKGNDIFDAALEQIKMNFPDKVLIKQVQNLPYKDYINSYNDCHILLDQIYAQDQGYNALEAMAKGKVVFTGAGSEWQNYYNLEQDTVAIHAEPSAEKIAKKLEWLINNPKKVNEISLAARAFIEREHNYIQIAKKYVECWSNVLD